MKYITQGDYYGTGVDYSETGGCFIYFDFCVVVTIYLIFAYPKNEKDNLSAQLKSLIEPVMIIFLAVIVGLVLLAVIVPMFNMYSEIT